MRRRNTMITQDYCRVMAGYNRWQNLNLTRAASELDDAGRRADRGAFFRSIMGTFNHLLWADTVWMGRFEGCPNLAVTIAESPDFTARWDEFLAAREAADSRMLNWAETLPQSRLDSELSWYSGAIKRDMTLPMGLCVAHFFNHQTHHRGQIHAMLTAAGARPHDTDLFAMPELRH
jgi:uncharacterized damage-inducible protein DinB